MRWHRCFRRNDLSNTGHASCLDRAHHATSRAGAAIPHRSPGRTDFLVMEFLEGETLAQRLAEGKLPLDRALQYGIQIAEGLAAAHKAGINVHNASIEFRC